ncbi:hypothetical protein FHG87_017149 [Trinorchestia longiramus]|nr:hypothetical protein FHG87_017149 [Trinorchestia longiramus]
MALSSPRLGRERENNFPPVGDTSKHTPEPSLDYGAVKQNNIEIRVNRTISTRHRIAIVKNESFSKKKERLKNLFVPGTSFEAVKGNITYGEDGNEYYEEEFFRDSSVRNTQIEQKKQNKNNYESKVPKLKSGRSFLNKIWGNRKKKNEASKHPKQVTGTCDQCCSPCPKHSFASVYSHRSGSRTPPEKDYNKESLIWERLSKGDIRQLQPHSTYNAPTSTISGEELQSSERRINRDDPRRKAIGRSHDRKFELAGHKHSVRRSPERVIRPPTEISHSQSTRASDRLPIPNTHNSQLINDRNQSESLCSSRRTGRLRSEDTNGSSRHLTYRESPDSNRPLNSGHSPGSHRAECDSRPGVIHRHVLKEFYDPKANRNSGTSHPLLTVGFASNDSRYEVHPHFLKDTYDGKVLNRNSEYQPSFPEFGYRTNTPSFRQYRRAKKDIRDPIHGGHDYRSSQTSSGHRRTQDDRRRRRRSSKRSHRSTRGTTTHRVCANGSIPHKADEKLSTLSRSVLTRSVMTCRVVTADNEKQASTWLCLLIPILWLSYQSNYYLN